jgi:hypothetical protein
MSLQSLNWNSTREQQFVTQARQVHFPRASPVKTAALPGAPAGGDPRPVSGRCRHDAHGRGDFPPWVIGRGAAVRRRWPGDDRCGAAALRRVRARWRARRPRAIVAANVDAVFVVAGPLATSARAASSASLPPRGTAARSQWSCSARPISPPI